MNPFYRRARFLACAHNPDQLPPDRGREVAFAGRSNAGKSSAINAVAGQRGLARTSKSPGRTRQLVFFELTADRRLVDLPGYGYARVPQHVKAHWQRHLDRYLRTRRSLKGLILVMDIRHPLTDFDRKMLEWCRQAQLPVHVLLTKADKLKRGRALDTLRRVREALKAVPGAGVQLFSAREHTGLDEVHAVLDEWLKTDAP